MSMREAEAKEQKGAKRSKKRAASKESSCLPACRFIIVSGLPFQFQAKLSAFLQTRQGKGRNKHGSNTLTKGWRV